MYGLVGQLGGGNNSLISQLMYLISFFLFFLFLPYIQIFMYIWKAKSGLRFLEALLIRSKKILVEAAKTYGCPEKELSNIDNVLDFFAVDPVTLDPTGIIRRLDHLITVERRKLERLAARLAPNASVDERANFENTLTTVMVLNLFYKYVRHLYILGRRTMSVVLLMQLAEALLPQLREMANAFYNSFSASLQGAPIGDGVGALVALHLIGNSEVKVVSEDVVMGSIDLEGRKVIVVKAAGPGGRVGRPGDAIARIIEDLRGAVDLVVMIDAALKMEGEESGSIAEGVGAVIGDPGPEKYKIEEVTTRYEIPLHAIVIKESVGEALSPMTRKLALASVKAAERVKEIILSEVPPGGTALVAGIGNTMGIGNRVGEVEQ